MRKILLMLALIVTISAVSQSNKMREYVNGFEFYVNDADEGTCVIVGQADEYFKPILNIPSTIEYEGNYYTVVRIASNKDCGELFAYSTKVEKIIIPPTLRSVCYGFYYFSKPLTDIVISDIKAWCLIDFEADYDNPTIRTHKLSIGDEEVAGDFVFPEGIEIVANCAFLNNFTSITLPSTTKKNRK